MGDRAVRWALQQTRLSAVAQIILVRMCKQIEDRNTVWIFRRSRTDIAFECNISERTLMRHFLELEAGDSPLLFRGFRQGRLTEYVILGPSRRATTDYLQAAYPGQFDSPLPESKRRPFEDDPGQIDPTLPDTRVNLTPPFRLRPDNRAQGHLFPLLRFQPATARPLAESLRE